MRQVEASPPLAGHFYSGTDHDSHCVRRGRVGGFVNYMDTADQAYVHERVAEASDGVRQLLSMTAYSQPA